MDKKLLLKLNGGRTVSGYLRGFDPFMNVVLDESDEHLKDNTKNKIGMVVSIFCCGISSELIWSWPVCSLFAIHFGGINRQVH
jgi:small nuclear ribonucleoprotein (snRNP)-like protein